MKPLRNKLAVLCGLLMAAGFIGANMLMGHWAAPKVLVGSIIGGSITWGLLNDPDRATSGRSLTITALALLGLDVLMAMTESTRVTVFTICWTALYAAAISAFAKLHWRERDNGTYPLP